MGMYRKLWPRTGIVSYKLSVYQDLLDRFGPILHFKTLNSTTNITPKQVRKAIEGAI